MPKVVASIDRLGAFVNKCLKHPFAIPTLWAMLHLGIDPGITGGVVVLDNDGMLDCARRTPIFKEKSKSHYDIPGMVAEIAEAKRRSGDQLVASIEKVGAMPRDGRVGAFSFGKGYGIWLGILGALQVPYAEVAPQRWQSKMLAGLPRGPHTKTSAVQRCKSLFPTLPIKVKADWGIADAALIAEYMRRVRTKGES